MARHLKEAPWPIILLVASFLCPTELSVYVAGARLPPHRALLLLLLPFVAARLLGGARLRVRAFDILFFLNAAWQLFVYVFHHGPSDGLQSGGALALDSFGSYLVARTYVRDERAFAATTGVLLMAVALAGLVALPEVLTGKLYVHEFLRSVTGYVHPVSVERRLGLTRAYGTFDHPIHLGMFCASGLAIAIYAARRTIQAVYRAVILAAMTLTGLSSAPILGLAVQAGLMGLDRVSRGIKGRVWIALAALVALFCAASLVTTRSPIAVFATGFTLDSSTAFYRLLIWQYGLESVREHLLFGIGLTEWERPAWMVAGTIDAYWLVLAVKGGVPAVLVQVAAIIAVCRAVGARQRRGRAGSNRLAQGWQISVAALLFVACTVHYWNVPYAYFFFVLGLGGCFADPILARRRARPKAAAAPSASPVRWIEPASVPGLAAGGPSPWPATPPSWPVPVLAKASY